MAFSKDILRSTIIDFIAVKHKTDWSFVLLEFEVDNKMDFYKIVDNVNELKNTISRFCKVCNMTVEEFKQNYRMIEALLV